MIKAARLNVGDRVKITKAIYQSDLQNKLNAGRTGVVVERYYTLTGHPQYTVRLDDPYEYKGYPVRFVDFMECDYAIEKIVGAV